MSLNQSKIQALSITTRGIGFATCNLCYVAAATANIEPPVYAMYRVFLGLAEAKLGRCDHYVSELRTLRYECKVKGYVLERPQKVTIVPAPIKRIIDAIDIIKHNGTTYAPVVAAQVRDEAGRLVPRPENLLLSNLREVVVALSTEDTPAEYRAAFKRNCPIPGAVWDNNLLMNADEIIPEGYDLELELEDNLMDYMWPLSMFLISMQEKYPLMASGVLSVSGANVTKAALISTDTNDLHAKPRLVGESLQVYCKRSCYPLGYSDYGHELEEVSDADRRAGILALLGELPNCSIFEAQRPNAYKMGMQLLAPVREVHAVRQGKYGPAGERIKGDYTDYTTSLMLANEALLSPVTPARVAQRDEPVMAPRPEQGNGRGRGSRNRRRNYQ